MTSDEFVALITNNADDIASAISTGAGWEIWLQVQLLIWLRKNNINGQREVQYPDNPTWHVDLLIKDDDGLIAVELKVQSANNMTVDIWPGILGDIEKVKTFSSKIFPIRRWSVGVVYEVNAKETLTGAKAFLDKSNSGYRTVYQEAGSIGVLAIELPSGG